MLLKRLPIPIEQPICLPISHFHIGLDVFVRSRSISENHSIVMNPLECRAFMITHFPNILANKE